MLFCKFRQHNIDWKSVDLCKQKVNNSDKLKRKKKGIWGEKTAFGKQNKYKLIKYRKAVWK